MSFGAVDYEDGQRVQNWDPTSVLTEGAQGIQGTWSSAWFPVSKWAGLQVYFKPPTQLSSLLENWAHHSDGTDSAGGRQQQWDPATPNALQITMPHLGPYVQLQVIPQSQVTTYNTGIHTFLTNRPAPYLTMHTGATIDESDAFTINANSNKTFVNTYGGGTPVGCYVNGGSQGVTVEFQYLAGDFAYHRVTKYAVAANVDDYRIILWPLHSIKTIITNQSAASNCTGVQYTFTSTVNGSS